MVDVKSKWRGQRGGAGGTWASDFPDEVQYVRRCILKRHFLMGPPTEYKFTPPPGSELEGRTHLASAHSGEVQRCLSFFYHIYFHPITEKNWGDFMSAAYDSSIHTFCLVSFTSLFSVCVCARALVRVCVMDSRIYNKRVSVSMSVKTLHGDGKKQQVSLWKEDNDSACVCWPRGDLGQGCVCSTCFESGRSEYGV